mgnify:CR=1 FL=1
MFLALGGKLKCESEERVAAVYRSDFMTKCLVNGSGAQAFAEQGICPCGAPLAVFTTQGESYGVLSVLPTVCDACKGEAWRAHEFEMLRGAHDASKVRCAGYQNKPAVQQGKVVDYNDVKSDFAFQSSFMEYIVTVMDGNDTVGAFVYGPTGTGKTFLCKMLHNELLKNYRNSCFIKAVDLALVMRKETFGDQYKEVLRDFRNVETLIIDDFGTQKDTDFVRETIFAVIDTRYDNHKRTIFTTNLKTEDIEKQDRRLSSRLQDPRFCRELKLAHKDLRTIVSWDSI